MKINRMVTVAIGAIGMTLLGVVTIGLAETVKFGLIGLAAAVLMLGLFWLAGRSSGSAAASNGGEAKAAPKAKSQGKPKR